MLRTSYSVLCAYLVALWSVSPAGAQVGASNWPVSPAPEEVRLTSRTFTSNARLASNGSSAVSAQIDFVVIPLNRVNDINLMIDGQNAVTGRTLREIQASTAAHFILAASSIRDLRTEDDRQVALPLGYVRLRRQELNRPAIVTRIDDVTISFFDSIFCFGEGKAEIQLMENSSLEDWRIFARQHASCIQGGPMFVRGRVPVEYQPEWDRSAARRGLWRDGASNSGFVCIDTRGRVVLGLVTLNDPNAARRLLIEDLQFATTRPNNEGGPQCETAVRLVGSQFGGLIAQSEITRSPAVSRGEVGTPIANAIGFSIR